MNLFQACHQDFKLADLNEAEHGISVLIDRARANRALDVMNPNNWKPAANNVSYANSATRGIAALNVLPTNQELNATYMRLLKNAQHYTKGAFQNMG